MVGSHGNQDPKSTCQSAHAHWNIILIIISECRNSQIEAIDRLMRSLSETQIKSSVCSQVLIFIRYVLTHMPPKVVNEQMSG